MKLRLTITLALLLCAASAQADSGTNPWQRSYDLESQQSYQDALTALYAVPTARRGYTWQLRRGWLLYLDGEHAEAIQAYQAATRLAPDAIEPRLGLLLPQLAERRWADAESTARAVLRLDRDNALANGRLAWALYNLGRHAEAEQAYQAALAAYPSDADLRAGLGWSQLQQGRTEQARASFQRVLEVAPEHEVAGEGVEALDGNS